MKITINNNNNNKVLQVIKNDIRNYNSMDESLDNIDISDIFYTENGIEPTQEDIDTIIRELKKEYYIKELNYPCTNIKVIKHYYKSIDIIKNHYLISTMDIIGMINENTVMHYDSIDDTITENCIIEFIESYIDLLTDLLEENRDNCYYDSCINITEHLTILYSDIKMLTTKKELKFEQLYKLVNNIEKQLRYIKPKNLYIENRNVYFNDSIIYYGVNNYDCNQVYKALKSIDELKQLD